MNLTRRQVNAIFTGINERMKKEKDNSNYDKKPKQGLDGLTELLSTGNFNMSPRARKKLQGIRIKKAKEKEKQNANK